MPEPWSIWPSFRRIPRSYSSRQVTCRRAGRGIGGERVERVIGHDERPVGTDGERVLDALALELPRLDLPALALDGADHAEAGDEPVPAAAPVREHGDEGVVASRSGGHDRREIVGARSRRKPASSCATTSIRCAAVPITARSASSR